MKKLKKQYLGLIPALLSLVFIGFWIGAKLFAVSESALELFSDSYWCIPLLGGLFGVISARHWGGLKSVFGRALFFMSSGLLFEAAGLLLYTVIYRVTGEELPYPSIGDAIFLLGVASYTVGTWHLLRTFAPLKRMVLKPSWHLLLTVLAMVATLALVWVGFLNEGIVDDRGALVRILNTAYPVMQLGFLFSTLLALFKVRAAKGGKMLMSVASTLVSLGVLYIADYIFLYQSYKETWLAGGLVMRHTFWRMDLSRSLCI